MTRGILLLILCLLSGLSSAQSESPGSNEELGCTFSFPWVNDYRFVDHYHQRAGEKSGFFGLGINAFYKKADRKVSVGFSFTEDLSSPAGKIDYAQEGDQVNISTFFGEFNWHFPVKSRFYGIVGMNLTDYRFEFLSNDNDFYLMRKTDKTVGLNAGLEYRFNKFLSAATFYRPAVGSFETDGKYRHVLTLDIRVDIAILKMKRNYF